MENHTAQKWRWLIFMAACLEMLLFSGVLFGWSSLVYVFKMDGLFSHLCTKPTQNQSIGETTATLKQSSSYQLVLQNDTDRLVYYNQSYKEDARQNGESVSGVLPLGVVTCDAQDNMLSLVWSVVSAVLYTTSSIAGFLSYKMGTRFTRLVGWFSFTLGGLITAFTSSEHPFLLFVGLPFLGFGGGILLITNIQVGMLFNKISSTVIATLSGLFDSSSIIMLFVKLAQEKVGFSRRNSFLVLCGANCFTLLNTLLLMPKGHFQRKTDRTADTSQTQEIVFEDVPLNEVEKEEDVGGAEAKASSVNEQQLSRKTNHTSYKTIPTLKECLLSPVYILEVCWISLLQLRFSHFLNSLNPLLTHRLQSEEEVSNYTNVLSYCMMGGLVISLISGATFDFFKHVFSKQAVVERRHLLPAVTLLSLTSAFAVTLSVTVLLPTTPTSLSVAFVFVALLRSFQYSVDANVISLFFPPQYYGALFGVSDFVGGAVSTLQYALVVWEQHAGFTVVHYFMLAVAVVTFIHPAIQLFRALRMTNTADPVNILSSVREHGSETRQPLTAQHTSDA